MPCLHHWSLKCAHRTSSLGITQELVEMPILWIHFSPIDAKTLEMEHRNFVLIGLPDDSAVHGSLRTIGLGEIRPYILIGILSPRPMWSSVCCR